MEEHCTSERPPFLRRQARAPTCQPCLSLREVACACSALARHCARSLWGRGPARALPTRARAAPSWRHSVHAPWKGTARARGRRSFGARPVLPRASPPSHCAWWLARVARLRATALALSGDEAQHVRFRRARAAPSRRHSVHALWKGTARARGRRSFGARPVLPRASPPSHCARWLARVARLRATALALSGDEAQHVRFRRARAPRQAGDTRSMHCGRALHEREAAVPSAPARAPTCQPCPSLREVACACSALARHCARSLWGRGPARALPTRARAAPRWRHSVHAPWKGTARARSRRSFGASPCSHVPALPSHCARWLARVARLRATALALSGDEAQHVRFRRARAAPRWRHSLHALVEGHCTSERPPFLRRQARAPTCQPCPSLREVACACSALARHCARSLSGRGPARALPTRARAAPRWRHSLHALWKSTARARSRRSFGASPCSHVPALPLTARVGLRV